MPPTNPNNNLNSEDWRKLQTYKSNQWSLEQEASWLWLWLWSWSWWWWWWWSSSSSWSLSSSSKGFSLWKMQHFLELFFCMNSLSTVPSFHVTFFFRFSLRTSVSCCCCCGGCWEDADEAGFSRVTVTVGDDEEIGLAVAFMGLAMVESMCSCLGKSERPLGFRERRWRGNMPPGASVFGCFCVKLN